VAKRPAKKPTATKAPAKAPQKKRPPEQTHEEVHYLRRLIADSVRIRVRLVGDEEVTGTIEYYDNSFIRLTREDGPNLFIFKHDIKYFYELDEEVSSS